MLKRTQNKYVGLARLVSLFSRDKAVNFDSRPYIFAWSGMDLCLFVERQTLRVEKLVKISRGDSKKNFTNSGLN